MVSGRELESFLDRFFGPGNDYWPGRNMDSATGRRLRPYLEAMAVESEVPYILPRLDALTRDRLVYVIPRKSVQATVVREYVNAFVVPTYARHSRRLLREGDPIDDAVVDFVGHRNVVLIQVPQDAGEGLWIALGRLRDAVGRKPVDTGVAPLPLGRLLCDFELALATGDNSASATLLDRIAGSGLSGSNFTYLVIKRLDRLGRYGELLRLPELKSVAGSGPPTPVRDAILRAIYRGLVGPSIEAGDYEDAKHALREQGTLVPPLAEPPFEGLSEEALTVLAVAAASVGDRGLARQLKGVPTTAEHIWVFLSQVAAGDESNEKTDRSPREEDADDVGKGARSDRETAGAWSTTGSGGGETRVETWRDLIAAAATGQDLRSVLAEEPWRTWPTPAESDDEIAEALEALDDRSAERAWSLAGPFVDSDDYRAPAARSARALITCGLLCSRFGPADLAGLVALTEIVLRSAPSFEDYTQLVDDLNEDVGRWASVERSSVVLDLADLLSRSASPNREARLRLVSRLLEPLSRHRNRLGTDELQLARLIDSELDIGLPWDRPEDDPEGLHTIAGTMLLYSLDEAVLARTKDALAVLAPHLDVRLSHDHVGSPQLREWARRADYIVMATRCAKHAATGFIRAHASDRCVLVEADGGGSASLLRAAIKGLTAVVRAA